MWSITDICARTGLSARTVRYYEEVGLLPGVRRRSSRRRVYGVDELERLGFISRLKALGLSLAEIRDLNAVYAIRGSTQAMLRRLRDLLAIHLADVERRIGELGDLRGELSRYRGHVDERVVDLDQDVEQPDETLSRGPVAPEARPGAKKGRAAKERMTG